MKALQVIGKHHRARVGRANCREGFALVAQCAQHSVRKDELLDSCGGRNFPNNRWWHMKRALNAGGTFGYCVMRYEQVRIARQTR